MSKPVIICLTPVKNEKWILDKFIQAVSLWADYIIIADEQSNDGSKEIAKSYEKVILIDNNQKSYNESSRQRLLISEARKIKGKKLLIALDADEFLTANFHASKEWEIMLNAQKGTTFTFDWVNIRPNFKKYWTISPLPFAYMDDGLEHSIEKFIHSQRIPINNNGEVVKLKDIKILHYQYVDWKRMQSKHRWYQCYELIKEPSISSILLYRKYHHMYALKNKKFKNIRDEWFSYYEENDIDMTSIEIQKSYWWDYEVQDFLEQYGEQFFKKLNIWNKVFLGKKNKDPRTWELKLLHKYLDYTQYFRNNLPFRPFVKLIDKLLVNFGF